MIIFKIIVYWFRFDGVVTKKSSLELFEGKMKIRVFILCLFPVMSLFAQEMVFSKILC